MLDGALLARHSAATAHLRATTPAPPPPPGASANAAVIAHESNAAANVLTAFMGTFS
jgi:hypothetical protein